MFCFCNKKGDCGRGLLFLEKHVDQLQMATGNFLWKMRGNWQNDLVEKLGRGFHAERLHLPQSRFGITRHTSK